MMNKSKAKNIRALKEASKRNGLIFNKHSKGTESDFIKLVDEKGNCFKLNNDLTIKKCDNEDNELAVTADLTGNKKVGSLSKKNASYKMQKGFQKA